MASVSDETLQMEQYAIKGTRALAGSLRASTTRLVSQENLGEMIAAYEDVIEALTENSMKEFPDA